MPDHRLRLRALLSQARIAPVAAVAALCTLLQLFGGSVAAVSYTIASDSAQFRSAS